MYKAVGTVIHLGDTVQVSEKFKKRELVLRIDGYTPQEVQFEAKQVKADELDGLKLHDEIEVTFVVEGRRWDGANGVKWFNTLGIINARKI